MKTISYEEIAKIKTEWDRIIHYWALKFECNYSSHNVLYNAGLLGAVRGYEEFREDGGSAIKTFVTNHIVWAIKSEMKRNSPLTGRQMEHNAKWRDSRKDLKNELGRKPTTEELKDRVGPDVPRESGYCNIDITDHTTGNPVGKKQRSGEFFSTNRGERLMMSEELIELVKGLCPDDYSRDLIVSLYCDGDTQATVAEQQGVSRQVIGQRLQTLLEFLRKAMLGHEQCYFSTPRPLAITA